MAYFSSLLFYTALSSIVVLLLTGGIKKLQPWNKLATAIALTFLTLAWIGLPQSWRWVMSAWSPGAVLQGWFILDMQPALWQWGTILGVLFAAVTWYEVAQKRPWLPLSGVLLVIFLCALWFLLLSGTLLMTLAFWAVFDLIWCAASLMLGVRSQRVLLATSVLGIVSVLLWSVTLFSLGSGDSGLWWLISPSDAIVTLLVIAVMVRTGVFGFQLITAQEPRTKGALATIHTLGVLAGLILLYRVIGIQDITFPEWSVLWPVLSGLWYGFVAWNKRGFELRYAASLVGLMAVVAVGFLTLDSVLLAQGAATWMVAMVILLRERRRDSKAIWVSWPSWLAVFVLLGLPISPLAVTYFNFWAQGTWLGRITLVLGLVLSMAALFRELRAKTEASNGFPLVIEKALYLWPTLALILLLFGLTRNSMQALPASSLMLAFVLWLVSILLGAGLLRIEEYVVPTRTALLPVVDLLGLEWLYQAVWDGSEVILGVVRIGADVVEGRGSLIWSVLILLLVMMVVVGQ